MTDLLSIGASGINVYKRALSTVSNNIANLGTDGYSKQVADLKQSPPQPAGRSYIGTGAYFDGVRRQYDSFLEQNLQRATADLESQRSLGEYAKRLLDLVGDDEVGLTSALNKFFSAAQQLTTDPGSSAYRSTYLRVSEELASRINSLADQFADLEDQAVNALQSEVESVNVLAEKIAGINKQLLRKQTEDRQPPGLLDERDQLLRDLGEFSNIATKIDQQGLVTLSLGRTTSQAVLVNGVDYKPLSISETAEGEIQFSILRLDSAEVVKTLDSGSIAGYRNFVDQTLADTRREFDDLIQTFADEINAIQASGLDLKGRTGRELFVFQPSVAVDQENVSGDLTVDSTVDLSKPLPSQLSVVWDGAADLWRLASEPDSLNVEERGSSISVGGLSIQIGGSPKSGDRLEIQLSTSPAENIRVGLTEGDEIAAASFLRVTENQTNGGGGVVMQRFDEADALSGVPGLPVSGTFPSAQTLQPAIGVIPAGNRSATITLERGTGSSNLNILTREGRQLLGTSLKGESLEDIDNSFFVPNSIYLAPETTTGVDTSFKGYDVTYGAFADIENVTELRPLYQFSLGESEVKSLSDGDDSLTFGIASNRNAISMTIPNSLSLINGLKIFSDADGQYIQRGDDTDTQTKFEYEGDFARSPILSLSLVNSTLELSKDEIEAIAQSIRVGSGENLLEGPIHHEGVMFVELDNGTQRSVVEERFESRALIDRGAAVLNQAYSSTLISQGVSNIDQATLDDAFDSANLTFGGNAIGSSPTVTGDFGLQASDVAKWLSALIDESDFPFSARVTAHTEFRQSNASFLAELGNTLTINEVDFDLEEGDDSLHTLVDDINEYFADTEISVSARIDWNGDFVIVDAEGDNIEIQHDDNTPNVVTGNFMIQTLSSEDVGATFELGLSDDNEILNLLGLDTRVRIEGDIDEELGVFVTGFDGDINISSAFQSNGKTFVDGLRDRKYEIEIIASDLDATQPVVNIYELLPGNGFDDVRGSLVASREYASEEEVNLIQYQGVTITLDAPAMIGDKYIIDGNNTGPGGSFDAQGNNTNMLRIVEFQKAQVVNGLSISDAYLAIVGNVGNRSTQAELSVDALEILKDQAVEARDRVSGVSLDEEAADLIRFQQAYQASAQVMQVATRLFDSILQVR